jgi:hypothetical protein
MDLLREAEATGPPGRRRANLSSLATRSRWAVVCDTVVCGVYEPRHMP